MVLGSQSYYDDEDIAFLRGMVPEGSNAQTGYEKYQKYLNEVIEDTQPMSKTLRGQRIFLMILKAGMDFVGSLLGGPPEQAVPCKYKRRQTKTTYGLRLYLARLSL